MGKMIDGNTAALNIEERRQNRLDIEQTRLEEAARPVYMHMMANLDSDVLDGAFQQITLDEYRSLEEDLGSGPMRNLAHAGLILSDALERFVMQQAVKEAQEIL